MGVDDHVDSLRALVAAVLSLIVSTTILGALGTAEAASVMSCTVVRRTTSAYWYKERLWSGDVPMIARGRPAGVFTEEGPPWKPSDHRPVGFLFSRLDEERAVVKQLYADGEAGAELTAAVMHRTADSSVLVMWPLPLQNEIRFALINFQTGKAVISQMGAGIVALGVAAILAECK